MRTATIKLKKFRTDFIFALITRDFMGLSRYFRLCKIMPQVKKTASDKFIEIHLKHPRHIFLQTLECFVKN